jgi:hypothetical protein
MRCSRCPVDTGNVAMVMCDACHKKAIQSLKDREKLAQDVGGLSCTDEDEDMMSCTIPMCRRSFKNQMHDAVKRRKNMKPGIFGG